MPPISQEEMPTAFERVAALGSLGRFNGDIGDNLVHLIDEILTQDPIEPSERKREELAGLFLWHAEFLAKDETITDELMRDHMNKMKDEFQKQTEKETEQKLRPRSEMEPKTPYDMLIKVFSLRKDRKLAQRRRNIAKQGI